MLLNFIQTIQILWNKLQIYKLTLALFASAQKEITGLSSLKNYIRINIQDLAKHSLIWQ